ncbi:unnamed protein product [Sphagnum balticum]
MGGMRESGPVPFCEEADDDWEKYKAIKEEDVKNAPKTKKSDGSWWMSFTDFVLQFDRVVINKNPMKKFKESIYLSEECSALFFRWNPTEGPFIVIPSSDGEERLFGYRLTVFSNNPVEMVRLDEAKNQAIIGRWERRTSAQAGATSTRRIRNPSQTSFLPSKSITLETTLGGEKTAVERRISNYAQHLRIQSSGFLHFVSEVR